MAVVHFKSKGGVIVFMIILSVIMCVPLINYVGVGGFIGVALLAILILVPIAVVISGGGADKRHEKMIENNTGIEKLRLVIRDKSILLGSQIGKDKNGITMLSSTVQQAMMAHMYLCDVFYTLIKENYDGTNKGELFDEMSEAIISNEKDSYIVASRVFGIAFSIALEKAAISANHKIQKTITKKFIDSHISDATCKKEVLKTMTLYFNFRNSNTTEAWAASLEKMTYALFNATIKREKGDVADPILIMPLKTAIGYARNNISVDDYTVKQLKEEGLIK